jgi:hypothetical protein
MNSKYYSLENPVTSTFYFLYYPNPLFSTPYNLVFNLLYLKIPNNKKKIFFSCRKKKFFQSKRKKNFSSNAEKKKYFFLKNWRKNQKIKLLKKNKLFFKFDISFHE